MGCSLSGSQRSDAGAGGKSMSPTDSYLKRRASLAVDNEGKLEDFYELSDDKKLGQGSYGSVLKATNKSTKKLCAVKVINKSQLSRQSKERLRQEVGVMKMLDHPNVVKLYEVFGTSTHIYLCMELCTGGELFERIIALGNLAEAQAAAVMLQVFRAICYLHENCIIHRDLKPENFLLVEEDAPPEDNVIKVIDFGFACQFTPGTPLTTRMGTLYYLAPEVLAAHYTHAADMWSCGVIMYTLLCGYPPFTGCCEEEVISKIQKGSYDYDPEHWADVSADARSLIRGLLRMNAKTRCTAEQALAHEWIKSARLLTKPVKLSDGLIAGLRRFRSQGYLKKAALLVIASRLNEDKISRLREAFVALDVNGDGSLTVAEIKEGLDRTGMHQRTRDLDTIIAGIDDGSGKVVYTEFIAAALDKRLYLQEDACWQAFCVFDRNGDGKITKQELGQVLSSGVSEAIPPQIIADIMKDADLDNSGAIDFREFMGMMYRMPRKPTSAERKKSADELKTNGSSSEAEMEVPEPTIGSKLGEEGKFEVTRRLARGVFAVRNDAKEEFMAKIGDPSRQSLRREVKLLEMLAGGEGIPRIYQYWSFHEGRAVAITDMLGPSLGDLQQLSLDGKQVTPRTALMIGAQILGRAEYLHSRGVVHRNVNDQTMVVGLGDRVGTVFVTGFQQSKHFGRTRFNTPEAQDATMKRPISTSALPWMSVSGHERKALAFRDDAESACFVIMALIFGKLPWAHICPSSKSERNVKIMQAKQGLKVQSLRIDGAPASAKTSVFGDFLKHCRMLKFEQQPDYGYLRQLLTDLALSLEQSEVALNAWELKLEEQAAISAL